MRVIQQNGLFPAKPIETTKDIEKSDLHLPDELDKINTAIK